MPTAVFTEAQFDRSPALNLKSVWLCLQQQIRQMLAQEPRGWALYAAAKAGVIALTKSAAPEYARQGVRINALVAGILRIIGNHANRPPARAGRTLRIRVC